MNYFKPIHRFSLFNLKFLVLAFLLFMVSPTAQAADTIKVGVLHSLSGTMAISETSLKDVALMAIEEINAKGGLLGKKLEPVVVDPASLQLLEGANLDYNDGLQDAGFKITNPNASRSCGCGQSFS